MVPGSLREVEIRRRTESGLAPMDCVGIQLHCPMVGGKLLEPQLILVGELIEMVQAILKLRKHLQLDQQDATADRRCSGSRVRAGRRSSIQKYGLDIPLQSDAHLSNVHSSPADRW